MAAVSGGDFVLRFGGQVGAEKIECPKISNFMEGDIMFFWGKS